MPSPSTYLILYTGVFLLATNGLFAKGIDLDAINITFLRSIIAIFAIALCLFLFKRSPKIKSKKTLLGVYGIGILMGGHWVTFFHSMQISTIAIGMLSLFTFPVITVFMESAVNRHWPHWRDTVSAICVLVGIMFMIADEPIELSSTTLQGVLWGILSALLFASRNVLQKYYFSDVSSDKLMLHQMLAIILLLALLIDLPDITALSKTSWTVIVALGLITTAGAHTLLVISYKRLTAKTVVMISCMQPVLAALLGWLFIEEQPTLFIVIGGAIILTVALYESFMSRSQRNVEPT